MRRGRPAFCGTALIPAPISRGLVCAVGAGLALLLAGSGCGRKTRVTTPPPARSTAPKPASVPPPAPRPVTKPQTQAVRVPPPQEPVQELPRQEPARPVPESPGGPPIRIGLTTSAAEVAVSSDGGFLFQEKSPEAASAIVGGDVKIRVESGPADRSEVFRIQVASLSRLEAAEELRQRLADEFSLPVVIREHDNGNRQVRLGAFPTRESAREFATGRLAEAGYPGGFVVEESESISGGEPRLALRGPERLFRVHRSGFLFFPASRDSLLRLDGKPYRGLLDVSLNRNGRLTVVNQLPMEEYLPGVVPAEISPTTYPAMAALAAQAVAARTFALRNMGKFGAEGFDLSNDVRSQVYGGVAAERPMTNDAVRLTAGLALYYGNLPIDAMYTSTCGGRTEDIENVFDSRPVPYLRGVECSEEAGDSGSLGDMLSRTHDADAPITGHDGTLLNAELELASVLQWINSADGGYLTAPPSVDEIRRWVGQARRLAAASGESGAAEDLGGILTNAGFLRYAAERVFGRDDVERRTSDRDAAYFLGNMKDGSAVPPQARRALAFLLQNGHWRAYPDNTARPAETVNRATAIALLVRWTRTLRPELLRTGILSSARDGLEIRSGSRTQSFRLAERFRLFKTAGTTTTPVGSLRTIGNERVRFHVASDGTIDFAEVELSPGGASSDRFSPVATWQTTLSRTEVTAKLRALAPGIGEVLDLRPARTGSSGRAVRIEVLGTRGSTVLNGYRVRGALGLRDTLFSLSRTVDGEGRVETFRFDGRGWGHGIGLCQVGAYGMARAGRTFEEILKTYYQGVELRRAY